MGKVSSGNLNFGGDKGRTCIPNISFRNRPVLETDLFAYLYIYPYMYICIYCRQIRFASIYSSEPCTESQLTHVSASQEYIVCIYIRVCVDIPALFQIGSYAFIFLRLGIFPGIQTLNGSFTFRTRLTDSPLLSATYYLISGTVRIQYAVDRGTLALRISNGAQCECLFVY